MAGFDNEVVYGSNWDFRGVEPIVGQMTTDGQLMIGSTASPNARVGALTSSDGSITISYSAPTSTTMEIDLIASGTADLHLPKYIVGDLNDGANYASIGDAIFDASAAGGGIVGIQDGTYSEDVTLAANVHLCALYTKPQNQGLGGVKIKGKTTAAFNGRCTISGLTLVTNDDFALSVSGASSVVLVKNCNFLCGSSNDNNVIEVTAGVVEIYESSCTIIGGFALFVQSGGRLEFFDLFDDEDNRNTVASTISAGELRMKNCYLGRPLTTSGTAQVTLEDVRIHPSGNTKAFTAAGSGAHLVINGSMQSGSATTITVTDNLTINGTSILANTATAIDGVGSISHCGLAFRGTGSAITTTTQAAQATGNLLVGASNSGATLTATVSNTSDTASSQAMQQVTVGGTSAGDAFTTYTVTGTTNWSQGIDNSVAGDPFVLAASTALGTTNVMSATTAGAVSFVLGDVDVTRSNSGAGVSLTVSNTSNTASSTAHIDTVVAGGTAADAYYSSSITAGQAWTWGLDNSDSDAWVLSASATPGTTNVMKSTIAGEVTFPLQPAFLAFLGTIDSDVTGNGATYTIGGGNALTEVYDIGGDFVTTGTFTAPVTGLYNLQMAASVTDLAATMTGTIMTIVTSNRSYQILSENSFAVTNLVGGGSLHSGSVLADMDAADTATFTVVVSGGPGDTADIRPNSTSIYRTYVSGFLQS